MEFHKGKTEISGRTRRGAAVLTQINRSATLERRKDPRRGKIVLIGYLVDGRAATLPLPSTRNAPWKKPSFHTDPFIGSYKT